MAPEITILAIESSCDDTSAAVICDGYVLSNLIANQAVHKAYGGVVPELASRAHQANIVPVVDQALSMAGKRAEKVSAIAFTRGPGLLGSLLVGTSFAKGFALARNIPLIAVNHLQAHVMSHFAMEHGKENRLPRFRSCASLYQADIHNSLLSVIISQWNLSATLSMMQPERHSINAPR